MRLIIVHIIFGLSLHNLASSVSTVEPDTENSVNPEENSVLNNSDEQNRELRNGATSRHTNRQHTGRATFSQNAPLDGMGQMKENILDDFRRSQNVQGSESLREISARLENGRRRIGTVLETWEASARDAERRIRYGAGPCNGRSNGIVYSGVSDRQMLAAFEGNDQNLCNHVNELRMEIERIRTEADRMYLQLQQSRCNAHNNAQSQE